jgi:hypothetical protein
MFGKKRHVKGMPPKHRTKAEVDRDYSSHAIQHGHKARLIMQLHKQIEALEQDLEKHLSKLEELNAEGMKLPQEPVQSPAAAPSEGPAA